ncbi:3'-5' exoribonuclease YhaM family protein [Bacteroidota bacterium]
MRNQIELIQLSKGDSVDHFLLIRKFENRTTKNGKNFLSLELGDRSATIGCNVWSDTNGYAGIERTGKTGIVIKVDGMLDEFQGSPQIKVSSVRLSKESDNISPTDFLPKSIHNSDEMESVLIARINKINNSFLKTLLKNIFSGERMNLFKNAPAGKSWHHGYIHGLIEHTLEIVKLCDLMCDFHNELNRDLLVSGALLHDFGKTEELSYDSAFEYTDKGKLVGHIVICASMIENETNLIEGFPEELKNLLIHLVLSHQGKLEYASPVVPKTAEAVALYQADELSAKVNAYIGVINSEMGTESSWTKFHHLAQTDLFRSGLTREEEIKINGSLFD